MKTTLTLEIEFNPEVTDAESVATALDRLLETIMGDPDIGLEDYGHPTVGEFLILQKPENSE
jgi:hypothetical protein